MTSAGKAEADVGDALAALMQERRSQAARLLAAQGMTRLDVLNFISHGVTKGPLPDGAGGPVPAGAGDEDAPQGAADPLAAYLERWPNERWSREAATLLLEYRLDEGSEPEACRAAIECLHRSYPEDLRATAMRRSPWS